MATGCPEALHAPREARQHATRSMAVAPRRREVHAAGKDTRREADAGIAAVDRHQGPSLATKPRMDGGTEGASASVVVSFERPWVATNQGHVVPVTRPRL